MKPNKDDVKYREAIDKLKEFDPLHGRCIFCDCGGMKSHERRGFARIMVFYCPSCKKTFEKVVEKKLTKPRESYSEE